MRPRRSAAGFIAFVVLEVARGRAGAVHPLLWGTSVLFLLSFALDPVKAALGVA